MTFSLPSNLHCKNKEDNQKYRDRTTPQGAQYPLTVSKSSCLGKDARYGQQILPSTTLQVSKCFWLEDFLSQTGYLYLWWLATNFSPASCSSFHISPQHLQYPSAGDSTNLSLFALRSPLFLLQLPLGHYFVFPASLKYRDLCYKHDNNYVSVIYHSRAEKPSSVLLIVVQTHSFDHCY